MMVQDLPAVNACLNGLSTIFVAIGYIMIKQGKKVAHRNCMVGALTASTAFLTCYVIYHLQTGHTSFQDPAWFRPIYLVFLASHVLLAVAIVPLVIITVFRAARGNFERHKKIARWTWPIWMYVSVTGVLIYLLLYQIFPQTAG